MAVNGGQCLGHAERIATKYKINKLLKSPLQSLDENFRVTLSVCELKFPSEGLVCQTSDRLLIREQQLKEAMLLIVEVDCEGHKLSFVNL